MPIHIEILGSGCKNCQVLYDNVQLALSQLGKEADVQKVQDLGQIMAYGILSTPGLVVSGHVVSTGKVCKVDELKRLLTPFLSA